jgi:hypothetical protein
MADVAHDLGCLPDHRLGTLEHALARLGKRSDSADRLIELVRDSARHLLQRGHSRDLEQLFEQYPGILHLPACHRFDGVAQGGSLPEAGANHSREFHAETCVRPVETVCLPGAILRPSMDRSESNADLHKTSAKSGMTSWRGVLRCGTGMSIQRDLQHRNDRCWPMRRTGRSSCRTTRRAGDRRCHQRRVGDLESRCSAGAGPVYLQVCGGDIEDARLHLLHAVTCSDCARD